MTLSHDDRMLIIAALNLMSDQFRGDATREYSYAFDDSSHSGKHRFAAETMLNNALKCITLRNRIIQEGDVL